MKSKLTRKFLTLGAALLTLFAFATSASACFWFSYQPEEPSCLREE
jgi:cyclic lactone autoinducer peptide